MKTAAQVQSIANQLVSQSISLVHQEGLRFDAIKRVKDNTRISETVRAEELAKVNGLEVLKALRAQCLILKADLDASSKDWSNTGQVLRNAALPLGGSPSEAVVMGMLRDEAAALEADPEALQSAMQDAALEKNWTRVYSLTLGRLDQDGRPLGPWKGGIPGLRFDCLDLPGQLTVLEALSRGEGATLNAEAAWEHATGQSGATTASLLANLPAKLAKAQFEREARMMLTPAEALAKAEAERTDHSDRFQRVGDESGLFCIFDSLTGVTRFESLSTGAAHMAKLNALTRIPTPAEELPLVSPITPGMEPTGEPSAAEPGSVPSGN